MASAAPYLIVHDGSETKDADVDIILLAHQPRVLQSPAPRKRAVPGGEAAVGEGLGVLTATQTAGCPLAAAQKGERGPCTASPEREGQRQGVSCLTSQSRPWSLTTQELSSTICAQTILAQQSSKIQQ